MRRSEGGRGKKFLVLTALLLFLLLPGTLSQGATANETTVFNYLTDKMDLNPAAACGVMSNIKNESGFIADIYGPGGSYGICQWLGVRRSRLFSWCSSHGYSSSSLNGQLAFLNYELKTYYPSVYNYMKSVSNTASGAYHAGYYWCYYFERPANTYSTSVYRGNVAKNTYWPSLGASRTYLTVSQEDGEGLKLTWNGNSKYGYVVRRSTSSKSGFQTIAKIKAGAKRQYLDPTAAVGKTYYYYIQPLNSKGKPDKKSNIVSEKRMPSLADEDCRITITGKSCTYNGRQQKPKVTVKYKNRTLKQNTHYQVIYKNNINAGTAQVQITGKGTYTGTKTLTFQINKAAQKIQASSIKAVRYTPAKALKVSASGKGKLTYLVENPKVAGVKGGKLYLRSPGVTRIKIQAGATKNYKAVSKTIKVTIAPAKPTVTGISNPGKGSVVLRWEKETKLSGFEIQYSLNRKFSGGVKKVFVPSGKAETLRVKQLKKGKTYYFRMRSCCMAEGEKLYGSWSSVRSVKVKK